MRGLDAIFFAVFLSQGELTPDGHKRAMDNALKTKSAFSVLSEYEKSLLTTCLQRVVKEDRSMIGLDQKLPFLEHLEQS